MFQMENYLLAEESSMEMFVQVYLRKKKVGHSENSHQNGDEWGWGRGSVGECLHTRIVQPGFHMECLKGQEASSYAEQTTG